MPGVCPRSSAQTAFSHTSDRSAGRRERASDVLIERSQRLFQRRACPLCCEKRTHCGHCDRAERSIPRVRTQRLTNDHQDKLIAEKKLTTGGSHAVFGRALFTYCHARNKRTPSRGAEVLLRNKVIMLITQNCGETGKRARH